MNITPCRKTLPTCTDIYKNQKLIVTHRKVCGCRSTAEPPPVKTRNGVLKGRRGKGKKEQKEGWKMNKKNDVNNVKWSK